MSKIRNDFNATLAEEQTNAIRKLTADNMTLISENDSLKKKIHELKHPEETENIDDEPVTGRRQVKQNSSKEIDEKLKFTEFILRSFETDKLDVFSRSNPMVKNKRR